MDVILCQPYLDGIGGAERVVLKLCEKFHPVVYTMKYDKEKTFLQFSDFDIRLLKPHLAAPLANSLAHFDRDKRMRLVAAAGLSILNTDFRGEYDVISSHLPPGEWLSLRNDRVTWYCHGPNAAFKLYDIMMLERTPVEKALLRIGSAVYRGIEMPAIKKIKKICTCSNATREKIRVALDRNDAEIAHPTVELEDFSLGDYGRFFFYSSRIVPEKRMEFVIEAFKKFNGRGKWKLVIAGHLFDNDRNTRYLKYLQGISAGYNIVFEINIGDKRLKELYSNCYSYLFSSMDEDWGIVLLEAMASSKPVISVNKGGPRESVVEGKTGFLVESPDEMAEKMRFLADHPDVCEKMGKAGRKRVEQNYTWKIFLDKMEKAFKETAKM